MILLFIFKYVIIFRIGRTIYLISDHLTIRIVSTTSISTSAGVIAAFWPNTYLLPVRWKIIVVNDKLGRLGVIACDFVVDHYWIHYSSWCLIPLWSVRIIHDERVTSKLFLVRNYSCWTWRFQILDSVTNFQCLFWYFLLWVCYALSIFLRKSCYATHKLTWWLASSRICIITCWYWVIILSWRSTSTIEFASIVASVRSIMMTNYYFNIFLLTRGLCIEQE